MSYGPGYGEGWTREGEPGYGPPDGGGGRRRRPEPDDEPDHQPSRRSEPRASQRADHGYPDPSYQDPSYQAPGYQTPGYQDPGYQTPGYQDPGYQDPGYGGGGSYGTFPTQQYPQQQPGYQQPYRPAGYDQGYGGYQEPSYQPPTHVFPSHPGYGNGDYPTESYHGPAAAPRSIEPPRGDEFGFGARPGPGPRRPEMAGTYGRPPARRPIARGDDRAPIRGSKRKSKIWYRAFVALGALILVAGSLLALNFLVFDGNSPNGAQAGNTTSPTLRDIGTRDLDPTPLSAAELFPATSVPAKSGLPYQVLKTQVSADCGIAATGDLATQLKTHGCNQVVRATLKTADGLYVITTGMFNLVDEAGADEVNRAIKPTVDAGKGRFVGYVTDASTKAFATAPTYIGFDVKGHFLAYCVIARADGKAFSDSDSALRDITVDLVEKYLFDTVLTTRASKPAGSSAIPTVSGS